MREAIKELYAIVPNERHHCLKKWLKNYIREITAKECISKDISACQLPPEDCIRDQLALEISRFISDEGLGDFKQDSDNLKRTYTMRLMVLVRKKK